MNGTAFVKDRHASGAARRVRRVLGFLAGSGRVLTVPGSVRFATGEQLPSGRFAGSVTILPASYVAGARSVSPDGDGGAVASGLGPADACYFPTAYAGGRADAA